MMTSAILALAVALTAQATDNQGAAASNELSRSPIPGFNCGWAETTDDTPEMMVNPVTGTFWAAALPVQVMITNSSTGTAMYCFSQDMTPVDITITGYFSADNVSYYSAGGGACFPLAPGTWFALMTKGAFDSGSISAPRPGKKPYRCGTIPIYSCFVTSDCTSTGAGTCAVTNGSSVGTGLAVVHGASGGRSTVCAAR